MIGGDVTITTDMPIYLDHNATTPLLPEVVEAMLPYLREHFGNPSSTHPYGRRAHKAVDRARTQVAELIGCQPSEIIFTSGGTEANNLAIRGVAEAVPNRRHVIPSVVEHPATEAPCRHLERRGWTVGRAPVDGTGRVIEDTAVSMLRDDTLLVTIMHANNETGAIQPIREIAQAARATGALVHTDAAQSAGKIPVRVDELGVDLLSIAGHKLYAPKGVGVLYVRADTALHPVLLGAGHERGLRPGTENVASIVGLGAACEIAGATLADEMTRVHRLRDRLWESLCVRIPGVAVNGHPTERLPNTLNLRFPGVSGNLLLAAAPEIAASTGSACHEAGESPSSVLTAMGLDTETALSSVRISLGRSTTEAAVDQAAEALVGAWTHLAGSEG